MLQDIARQKPPFVHWHRPLQRLEFYCNPPRYTSARVAWRVENSHKKALVDAMNSKVEKTINGRSVCARPVYKGGTLPAYWACEIDERVQLKTFRSVKDVFRFAATYRPH